MTPYLRNVLLESAYALDHLAWTYRSEMDRTPTFRLTADDICLTDFSNRASALIRGLLDEDSRRRGPRLEFKPPSAEHELRLRAAIEARRRALKSPTTPSPTAADSPLPALEMQAHSDVTNTADEENNATEEEVSSSGTSRNRMRPR